MTLNNPILEGIPGWWYTYPDPSEKYEFVSWDEEIPNWMEKIIQLFQTTKPV